MSLICMRHPRYDGVEKPVLSCKTCCTKFISTLKQTVAEGGAGKVDAKVWLDEKRRELEEAKQRAQGGNQG